AFFKKLKDRLFKSSSKLDEALEEVIAEAPAPLEEVDPPATQAPDAPAQDDPDPIPQPLADPHPDPVSDPLPEPLAEALPEPLAKDLPAPQEHPRAEPEPQLEQDVMPEPLAMPDPVVEQKAEPQEVKEDLPTPQPAVAPSPEPESQPARPSLLGRLTGRQPAAPKRILDDAMLEQLEDVLITADLGVDTALKVTANLAATHMGRRVGAQEIKALLSAEVTALLEPVAKPMPIFAKKPQVVLVVGVNGSGKTTTIGKLASQFQAAGKSVVIAAGDTFRAAAVEQLQILGDRAGVPVLKAEQGTDPASLAFDALAKAEADGADLLLIDTAGRLQNRSDLMEELAKIVRVLRKRDPEAPHNTLLVLDATTGQNALSQVETFRAIADVTGLVMTKLDGTAKGGVLVALAEKFGLPIHAIGVGEAIDDLAPFDPEDFANALTGADG
ncbi:MAG: signal recognition particle-docking protein FtsY, partial [Pseudomonadota bacterium]